MTIAVDIVVRNFAYGNPASLGEPLGLWAGESNTTGDATGGFVQIRFTPQVGPALPDERLRYVYFVDGITGQANTNPGNLTGRIFMHMARANVALGDRFFHSITATSLDIGGLFAPSSPLMSDFMTRTPVFWDSQELAVGTAGIVDVFAQVNTLGTLYLFRAYGRYYDRQILSNRSFGRLVSPPPVAPFG